MPPLIHMQGYMSRQRRASSMFKEVSIMENNTKRRMLTIGEAARLIDGITEYRIRQMCKSGQLRSFKAGNKFLIAENYLYEAVFGKSSVVIDGGKV